MGDKNLKPTGLDWVQLETDMNKIGHGAETTWERVKRKCQENPFVPIGASVTVGALTLGVFNFYKGRSVMQQRMMRLRVGAQLFTIFAAITGVFLTLPKEKRNLKDFIESGKINK